MDNLAVSPPSPPVSTRVSRPTTVSAVAGFPLGVGVEVAHQVTDRLALSGEVGTLGVISTIGAQVRFYPVASERAGLYLSAGPSLVTAGPTELLRHPEGAPIYLAGKAMLGAEFRAQNGITVGGELGVMAGVLAQTGDTIAAPAGQIRLGYSF